MGHPSIVGTGTLQSVCDLRLPAPTMSLEEEAVPYLI